MDACDTSPFAIPLIISQAAAAILGIGIIFVTVVEYKRNITSQKPNLVGLVLASHIFVLLFLLTSVFADEVIPTCKTPSLLYVSANDMNAVFAELAILFNTLASIQRFSIFTTFLKIRKVVLAVLSAISISLATITLAAYANWRITGIDIYTYCTIICMLWMLSVELTLTFKMMNAIFEISSGAGVIHVGAPGTQRTTAVRNHASVLTRNAETKTAGTPATVAEKAKALAANSLRIKACFGALAFSDVLGIALFAWGQSTTDMFTYVIVTGVISLIVALHVTMSSIFLRFYHQVYNQQG